MSWMSFWAFSGICSYADIFRWTCRLCISAPNPVFFTAISPNREILCVVADYKTENPLLQFLTFPSSHHGLKVSKWLDHLNRKAMMATTSFIAKVAPLKWFLTKKLSKIFWNIESKSRLHHCWDSGPCHHSIKSAPGSQPSELNLPSQMSPRLVLTGGR